MRLNRLFSVAMLSIIFGGTASAQQPFGGCWHPDDIKNWSPETDKNAKFNRSKVPLANRFKEPTLMKANANQFYEGQICNSTILYPTCSACPSQGANNFLGYQPTYWQYMDKLVYWAGSASEGIIIPPPAPSTDAAHQSGVKSLGQIFFPPAAFGGNSLWVRQMLTKENGTFPYAKKLYEIAKYMGFDGWFINEETNGGSSPDWPDFIKEFNRIADENGDTQMEIQWYNASHSPNTKILATHKNTSQFLEYGSSGDNRGYASSIGCTVEETFSKIYAGVQIVNSGHTGWNGALDNAMPKNGHVGSLDLFCPEERIWKDNVKDLLGKNDTGKDAYAAIESTFKKESEMWVNQDADPSQTNDNGSWRGVSGAVLERSTIGQMPFVSSFCVGVGKHRFVEGVKEGTQDWYHSGVQSIMPTWRWWIENKGNLTASINWDDAYNFGSSVKISGNLTTGDHLMRLYKTMIPVTAGGTLRVVYKTTAPGTVEMKLATESSVNPDVTLTDATITEKNGWTIADYDLTSLNGKTIYMIALNMKGENEVSNYELTLGELAVLPAAYAPASVAVENLASTTTLGAEKNDVRLTWDYTYNDDFDHFDIYMQSETGTRQLVGQTRGEGFFIPTFVRNENDKYINLEVVPVMKDMKQQEAKKLQLDYPKATAPVVSFSLGKSYLKVGETTTITAKGTGNPTSWKWILPEGLTLAEGSSLDQKSITVVANKVGKQEVKIEVTNAVGTSVTTKEVLEVMDEAGYKEVYNVIMGKKVVDFSSSTNSTEVPDRIIDGVTRPGSTSQKWCNTTADNWAIFDLLGSYKIYGFTIYDGNSGPESGVDQIDSYQIMLSEDGKEWTVVVDTENRVDEDIKHDYIPPFKARYVKLVPHVNGTLRIWEFEVYGKDDNNMTIELPVAQMTIEAGTTQNLVVKYELNGDKRDDNFKCTATSQSGNVTFGEIVEDKANGTFTIPVVAAKKLGTDKVTVKVSNGGPYKERSIDINIDANDQPNILTGQKAEVRQYKNDYKDGVAIEHDTYNVSGLTDGNKTDEALLDVENESTHKNDLWAIFTAPEDGWDLSKVVINVPNGNKGTNANDKEGFVNKDISIAIGNDINQMDIVKTFSDLEEVSQLEYIFPEYKNVKYLAVVCNLNAYFYPSLAEVEAYEQYGDLVPQQKPVAITGWNADVIAEATPAKSHSNMVLDDQGWVLYSDGVQSRGSIAGSDGIVKTNAGTLFKLADYAANNALVMKTTGEAHELTFETPSRCKEVYLLVLSTNGISKLDVVANYEDGSSSAKESFSIADWNDRYASGAAKSGLSRIITKGSWLYDEDEVDWNYQFSLYELSMTTDDSKTVKSLTLTSTESGKYPTILAVSKMAGKQSTPTGIENIENRPAVNAAAGIYTINGVKINSLQKGINIIKMADGTTRKVVIK